MRKAGTNGDKDRGRTNWHGTENMTIIKTY